MDTILSRPAGASDQVSVKAGELQTAEAAVEELEQLTSQTSAMTEQAKASVAQVNQLANQTEEARRQTEAAEAALNASIRPLIADVPRGTLREAANYALYVGEQSRDRPDTRVVDVSVIHAGVSQSGQTFLYVPVRNVGAGSARMIAVGVADADAGEVKVAVPGRLPSVLAPTEVGVALFSDADSASDRVVLAVLLGTADALVVEVAYTDVSGKQEAATQLFLTSPPTRRFDELDLAYEVSDVRPLVPRQYTA
jgi:hypothetical protein